MRGLSLLLLVLLVAGTATPATAHTRHSAAPNHPARQMLGTLESMTTLLDSVHTRQAADAAAPQLAGLYKKYRTHRNAAEDTPPMSGQEMTRHLARMDHSMDAFRMACARLMQEKFYGSTKLGGTVRKIAQGF